MTGPSDKCQTGNSSTLGACTSDKAVKIWREITAWEWNVKHVSLLSFFLMHIQKEEKAPPLATSVRALAAFGHLHLF